MSTMNNTRPHYTAIPGPGNDGWDVVDVTTERVVAHYQHAARAIRNAAERNGFDTEVTFAGTEPTTAERPAGEKPAKAKAKDTPAKAAGKGKKANETARKGGNTPAQAKKPSSPAKAAEPTRPHYAVLKAGTKFEVVNEATEKVLGSYRDQARAEAEADRLNKGMAPKRQAAAQATATTTAKAPANAQAQADVDRAIADVNRQVAAKAAEPKPAIEKRPAGGAARKGTNYRPQPGDDAATLKAKLPGLRDRLAALHDRKDTVNPGYYARSTKDFENMIADAEARIKAAK